MNVFLRGLFMRLFWLFSRLRQGRGVESQFSALEAEVPSSPPLLDAMAFALTDVQDPWPFVIPLGQRIGIIVVGAGGTGSWLIPHLARLVYEFNRKEEHIVEKRSASLLIVDHDIVEEKNVKARQNFCPPEIGYPKAQVLSNRMALAFAMNREEISARVASFDTSMVRQYPADSIFLVGCVDTVSARSELARCLTFNSSRARITYIDGGNGSDWGQIFIGNTATVDELKGCLRDPICARLPSPALLAPSMFVVPKEEKVEATTVKLSCGDLMVDSQEGNRQSRTINNHMASLMYAYVERLIYGSITTFATWTNLAPIDTHSSCITPQALAIALGKEASFASFFTLSPDEADDEDDEDSDPDDDEILAAELEEALP
ncbi:MAG: ThiF family adenylyltransferase [Ktedonobacteraceae bacterium]|nr:ThiF family adenylyltransferase [Ktedonobacteraceae bacterium]